MKKIDKARVDIFDSFAEDLIRERAPRLLIIVAASKVDTLLSEIISAYLKPKMANGGDQDELLEGDNPLATFSSRIKLCCRLGIISVAFARVLDQLRNLRNRCAHSVEFNINKSPARERVDNLRRSIGGRQSFALTKERYFEPNSFAQIEELQCLLLTLCALLESIYKVVEGTKGNKITLRISDR